MVELIRNKELTGSEGYAKFHKQSEEFLQELCQPLDNYGRPLVYLLFELLPPFYTGYSPHFPIKKILLLIWKVLLATLGGFEELNNLKKEKRKERGLPVLEDTIAVAGRLPATVIASDADHCEFLTVSSAQHFRCSNGNQKEPGSGSTNCHFWK